MPKQTLLPILKQTLPIDSHSWIIPALMQEPFVWNSLKNPPFLEQVINQLGNSLEDWSASAVMLVSLGLPSQLRSYRQDPVPVLEGEIRQQVAKIFDNLTKGEQVYETTSEIHSHDAVWFSDNALPKSGLLALALRERLRLVGTWEGIADDFSGMQVNDSRIWFAPVTCLLGLIPDPTGLILEFTKPDSSYEMHALGIHGLLSLPLPPEDQFDLIKTVFIETSPKTRWSLLNILAHTNPRLTIQCAEWLSNQPTDHTHLLLETPGMDLIEELIHLTHHAEMQRAAHKYGQSLRMFENAINVLDGIKADYSSRWAATALKSVKKQPDGNKVSQVDIFNEWKKAIQIDSGNESSSSSSPYHLGYSSALIQAGDQAEIHLWISQLYDEAHEIKEEIFQTIPEEILLSLTQYFASIGEFNRARLLAIRLTERFFRQTEVEENGEPWLTIVYGTGSEKFLGNLGVLTDLLYEIGLFTECIEAIDMLLKEQPGSYASYLLKGKALHQIGMLDQAVEAFQFASILNPGSLDIMRRLADELENANLHYDALAEREEILKISLESIGDDKYPVEDAIKLASSALNAGKHELSIEVCHDLLEKDVSNWQAHMIYGSTLAAQNDLEEGINSVRNATQLASDYPAPWLAMASIYLDSDQVDHAVTTLKTAVNSCPDSIEIHLTLGSILLDTRSLTSAEENLRLAHDMAKSEIYRTPASEMRGSYILTAQKLGETLRRLGHLIDARQVLGDAVKLISKQPASNHIEILFNYALTLKALGEHEESLPILRKIVEAKPEQLSPYLEYGRMIVDTRNDHIDEAVQVLEHVHSQDPANYEALALLADAYAINHKYELAMQAYLKVMESDLHRKKNWQERICFGLGKTALKLGQIDTSIAALQDAVQSNPRNPNIYQHLADACWAADLHYDAWSAAQSAISLDADNTDILTWFADHTIKLFSDGPDRLHNNGNKLDFVNIDPDQKITNIYPVQILNLAIQAYQSARALVENEISLLRRLGQLQAISGETDLAKETLHKAIQSSTPEINELHIASQILFDLQDIDGAIIALEKAVDMFADESTECQSILLKDLVNYYLTNGNPESAKKYLQWAIDINEKDAEFYQTMALVAFNQGEEENGLELLAKGLEIIREPEGQVILHDMIGRILQHQNKYGKALKHIEIALALFSGLNTHAAGNLTEWDLRQQAVNINRAILEPTKAEVYLNYFQPESINQKDIAINNQVCFEVYCTLADLALDRHDFKQAETYFNQAKLKRSELSDDNVLYNLIDARLLWHLGEIEDAKSIFEKAFDHLDTKILTEKKKSAAEKGTVSWETPAAVMFENMDAGSLTCLYTDAINTALTLQEWEPAIRLVEQSSKYVSKNPSALFSQARTICLLKEHQNLCDELEIISHASPTAEFDCCKYENFHTALKAVEKEILAVNLDSSTRISSLPNSMKSEAARTLEHWQHRGKLAFYREVGNWQNLTLALNSEHWELPGLGIQAQASFLAGIRHIRKISHTSTEIKTTPLNMHPQNEDYRQHQATLLQLTLSNEITDIDFACQLAQELVDGKQIRANRNDMAVNNFLLARIAYQTGSIKTAKKAVQNALTIWPDEPRWKVLAGKIFVADTQTESLRNNYKIAIAHLEDAIQLEPACLDHYLNLNKIFIDGIMFDPFYAERSIETLENAIQYHNNKPLLWLELAKSHLQFSNNTGYQRASDCAEKVITLLEEKDDSRLYAEAVLLKARIELNQKRPKEAAKLAHDVMLKFPDNSDAVIIQVIAYEILGDISKALNILENAPEVVRCTKDFQLKLAELLGKHGDENKEISVLRDLSEVYDDDIEILRVLGDTLTRYGQIEQAVQVTQSALTKAPPSTSSEYLAKLHHMLGRLLIQIGQLDQAVHHLSQAIHFMPSLTDAYLDLGTAYQKQRQHVKAQKTYQQGITVAPADSRLYVQAALSYKEGRDYQAAESMLRKAAELDPYEVGIRKQLAAVIAINLVQNPHAYQAQ